MRTGNFRDHCRHVARWMADYYDTVDQLPVRSQVQPGEILALLPEDPPDAGEPFERLMEDFESILPGITHWQHPKFFAYFPASSSQPSVLAEMLTASLGAQCMSWETSPAATELEQRVLDWLRRATGLPAGFTGSIQDTASASTLCSLLVARDRVTNGAVAEEGLSQSGILTTYASTEAHSSVGKAVRIAGLGSRYLREIPVDDDLSMRAEALEDQISADVRAGLTPTAVVATLGTTGGGGFDRLAEVGPVCRKHGVWLHVDAAWAGSALVAPEFRWMLEGVEFVDSFVMNPHKWLFTNFDCSAFYVRDPEALIRVMATTPEYLKTRHGGAVVNYRDWGIPLGRRFRALKLWFVMRHFGIAGLRERIREHVAMARELAEAVDGADDFELVRPPTLSLLCFRFRPAGLDDPDRLDAVNERLLNQLNNSGALYVTHTRLGGSYVIRFVVGQERTERVHVREAWDEITSTARSLS